MYLGILRVGSHGLPRARDASVNPSIRSTIFIKEKSGKANTQAGIQVDHTKFNLEKLS
jgi:hypothetical protein